MLPAYSTQLQLGTLHHRKEPSRIVSLELCGITVHQNSAKCHILSIIALTFIRVLLAANSGKKSVKMSIVKI